MCLQFHHSPVSLLGTGLAAGRETTDRGHCGSGAVEVGHDVWPQAALQRAEDAPSLPRQVQERRTAVLPGQEQSLVNKLLDHIHFCVPVQLLWGRSAKVAVGHSQWYVCRDRIASLVGRTLMAPRSVLRILFLLAGLHGLVYGAESR